MGRLFGGGSGASLADRDNSAREGSSALCGWHRRSLSNDEVQVSSTSTARGFLFLRGVGEGFREGDSGGISGREESVLEAVSMTEKQIE